MSEEAPGGAGPEVGDTLPSAPSLAARVREAMEAGWRAEGFTVPNPDTYPWQWLWDSCFHAIVWAALGDERATVELASVFDAQEPSGFVPHLNYRGHDVHADFWGRPGTSCITQPPMYGHAAAELVRRGLDVSAEVLEQAERGLLHLLEGRARHASGLVPIVHPWESGADDSPRWDDWCPGGFDRARWYEVKGRLVASIELDRAGSPAANPEFDCAPVGFNASVGFNALELASVVGSDRLSSLGRELTETLHDRWDDESCSWFDAGSHVEGSGRVRTLDALLPSLLAPVDRAATVLASVLDVAQYGGRFGPAGVHRDEPSFEPGRYWRGPAWPQLTYLLRRGATGHDLHDSAARLATCLVKGADRSGLSEYWHPDTGEGLGARPQGWAGLAVAVRGS